MPTYDYHCTDCSHQLESFQKITDAPLKTCPKCGNDNLHRGPGGGIGLSFKGSGFYINDYGPSNIEPPAEPALEKSSCCPCGKNSSCQS